MKSKLVIFFCCLLSCSCKAVVIPASTKKVLKDTVFTSQIKLVSYRDYEWAKLNIGKKIEIPEMNFKIERLNDTLAVLETKIPTITEVHTQVKFVPVKIKQKHIEQLKVKDKSRVKNKSKKSGNQKSKINNKQVRRGFPWIFILIVIGAIVVIIRLAKRYAK